MTGLELTSEPPAVDEGASARLAAWQLLDDASYLTVSAASVGWSVVSGPLSGIDTAGVATAGPVYQDTSATVQGTLGTLTGMLDLTLRNVLADNFGSYAGDLLDDAWQVQYFGQPPNTNAEPLKDPDGDGQNNQFEFTAGVIPTDPASRFLLRVELAVDGACAVTATYGAKLTLDGSGREIAYSRLHVADAEGRELTARFEATNASRIQIRVDDLHAIYPIRIDPTFSDADWSDFGRLPGVSGEVYAVVPDGSGNLYIGGAFTAVGDVSANHIIKWNGSDWSALGTGMNSSVSALTVTGADLYAGGDFATAGGTSWSTENLTGSIAAGAYYLIRLGPVGTTGKTCRHLIC